MAAGDFFDVRVDAAKAAAAVARAPTQVLRRLRRAMYVDGQEWRTAMLDRVSGNPLARRTGGLARSIESAVEGEGWDTQLRNRISGRPDAIAHEEGRTIVPRNARNLTIPLDDNLTAAGVPIFPRASALPWYAKGEKRVPGSGKARVIRLPSGKAFIVRDAPGDVQFLFALVKRVTLPGPKTDGSKSRLGFFDTWRELEKSRQKRHSDALLAGISDAVKGGGA